MGVAPARMHMALLRAEVISARIDALTLAEPEIGRLWRTEAAFAEAVRSVGLEDVRISEPEIVARLAMNRTSEIDARGAELAQQILQILRAPGDVLKDPVNVVRRIERAAAPVGVTTHETEKLADEEILDLVDALTPFLDMPVAAAVRAVSEYSRRSGRRSPAAERLVFSAVESSVRAGVGEARAKLSSAPQNDDLLAPVTARWIVAPASALAQQGFRLWSPTREDGMLEFLGLVAENLSWSLGHLGRLRHDAHRIRQAGQGRHGRSRMAEMTDFVLTRPIFTSGLVMDELGVTRRTALNMIGELEASGLVRNLVPRRAARFWATASLAERLRVQRTSRREQHTENRKPAVAARESEPMALQTGSLRSLGHEGQEVVTRALDELDRAMAEADEILKGGAERKREIAGSAVNL